MNIRATLSLLERSRLPQPWNPKQIDPALLTFEEYYKIANDAGKWHPSEAYQSDLKDLNKFDYTSKANHPHFLKRVRLNGLMFEFRLKAEKAEYMKRDPNGQIVRTENGRAAHMSDEEIAAAKLQPYSFAVAIYDEDGQCCGRAQDEWGCMLIMVAQEYRGFGLGPILGRLARTYEPGKTSGGFTTAGANNFRKLHREMVRAALTTGRYNALVKSGGMSPARAKEIIASAKLENKPTKSTKDYRSDNPKDWLLYAEDSCFVIYDRKLKDQVQGRDSEELWQWGERMIKGYLLVREFSDEGIVVRFGGDTPAIKRLLLTLGTGWCASVGMPLAIDGDDLPFVDERSLELGPAERRAYGRRPARPRSQPIDARGMAKAEREFRKSFDEYDEFKHWILDLADRKFRPEDKEEAEDDDTR